MEDYGLVSIITPTWNCACYITETIMSVINQTYQNFELLVQDDCSTDNTAFIVNKLMEQDSRIKYECNSSNRGAAHTRNMALMRAKGRWIAFLDSDDLWKPTKLERQLKFMTTQGYHFSCTERETIDEKSKPLGKLISGPKQISKKKMFQYCWPGCLTVMYDANYIGLIQIENLKKNNDYAMWLKVIKKADCFLLKENLASYRQRRGSISHDKFFKLIKSHYELFRKGEGLNPISSLLYTIQNMIFGVVKKIMYVKSIPCERALQ